MLVDDEPQVIRTFRRLLSRDDRFAVSAVDSSRDALSRILQESFDLILMDIDLGIDDVGGIECVRAIRRESYTGLICMMTGYDSPQIISKALSSGADDYIIKGQASEHLNMMIDQLLKKHSHSTTSNQTQKFDPIKDGALLRSMGLSDKKLQTLSEYTKAGFPDIGDLASSLNISASTLSRRLTRISKIIGAKNRTQLVRILTIASEIGTHKR